MSKLLCTLFFGWLKISFCLAQVGGDHVFEFLNLPASARISALGGSLISVIDEDVTLAYTNPALLNTGMHNQLSFNANLHFAGIHNGYVSYGHHLKKRGITLHGGIKYIRYGTFDETNEFGQITGTFKAAEYAFTGGAGKQLSEHLSVGVNMRLVSSQLESYNSLGLLGDLGLVYHDTSSLLTIAFVLKNTGVQLSHYDSGNKEPVPFEIQAGISKRLAHLPFRFSITYHSMQRWNVIYDDPNTEETTFFLGDATDTGGSDFVDNLFRHLIFSGELLLGKSEAFRLRVAYNHFRKKELSVSNSRSLAGFSMGLGFRIKRFRIDYGRSIYHLAGAVNHFGISTNLSEFKGS